MTVSVCSKEQVVVLGMFSEQWKMEALGRSRIDLGLYDKPSSGLEAIAYPLEDLVR